MLISEVGEVQLIKRLTEDIKNDPNLVVTGIGDDTAAIKPSGKKLQLITKDMLVEGIHFLRESISPWQLGRKALAVNISDIAAMGGVPSHLLTAAAVPSDTDCELVEEIFRGIKDLCREHSINLIGGDTVGSLRGITISITLLGEVGPEQLLLRSGAREGDLIAVTGFLGTSAVGLELLLQGDSHEQAWEKEVLKAHLEPPVRLKEARLLAETGVVTSMIDLSDGLQKDIGEICGASGVGARIYAEQLPISEAAREACRSLQIDPVSLAFSGGEDYELLFTFSPDKLSWLKDLWESQMGQKLLVLGEIVPKEKGIEIVDSRGGKLSLTRRGFIHF